MGQMFGAFRQEPFPTGYGPMPTAVTADVLETGIAVAFATIYFSFMLAVVPGRSLKEVRVLWLFTSSPPHFNPEIPGIDSCMYLLG